MPFCTRLVFVAVALLTSPIASRGQQCPIPTQEDAERAGTDYLAGQLTEGGAAANMTVHNMSFTCLARVALDKYSSASVVAYATSNANPPVTDVFQFQLLCSGSEWIAHPGSVFDSNVPPNPFDIGTELRCSACLETAATTDNYNADLNCLYCDPACGNQFCTGTGSDDCCAVFNNGTGECVNDCTMVHPEFAPNEEFVCVCNVSCGPGYTANFTACSCELTNGCEAAGQPCDNGGTCASDLSTEPFYICNCPPERTGENCGTMVVECDGCEDGQCDSDGCCSQCRDQYMLDQDNCTCVEVPTTDSSRSTEPTGVCPETCRDCSTEDPTCCTVCVEGYSLVRPCECVEDEPARTLAAEQVAGIAIGLVLFVLLILALAVLLAYVIYYFYDNKQKLKKGTALSPFSNGESHSNPLYLTPEEVDDQ